VSYGYWWVLTSYHPHLARALAKSPFVVDVILYGLVPAAPALLALAYTVRTAGRAPQAPPAVEEQGSLDISIRPIRSE
jgi:hypothetical protein